MKLELKHIAPYLPYGLKMYYEFLHEGKPREWTLMDGTITLAIKNQNKPILRPLSDLTKQNVLDITEYSDIEDVVFGGNPSSLYFINSEDKTYLDDYLNSLEYLFKHHFDVFGLIPEGLAIDINTIEK